MFSDKWSRWQAALFTVLAVTGILLILTEGTPAQWHRLAEAAWFLGLIIFLYEIAREKK